MSGGVDSAVAAALLKQQDYSLIGVFMKFWPGRLVSRLEAGRLAPRRGSGRGSELFNRCCSSEAESRARQVATILDIPFYVFNFEKEFKKRIVDYFLREYKQGRTPNPCVNCNKEIKFGLLMDKVLGLGADYVATGHYARLRREIRNPTQSYDGSPHRMIGAKSEIRNYKYKLFRGKDKTKDQSYFLWKLNQKQLKHILFPVGEYTKTQVRNLAKKFNLPVLDVPESQEICFIKTTVNDFLAKYIKTKSGPILTIEGKKIGQHRGLPFYTIGQRKGIELSGGPFYVVDKDFKNNILIVTPFFRDKSLYKKSLIAKDVNWVSGREPKLPLKIKAQIRYGHKSVPATIYNNKIANTLKDPGLFPKRSGLTGQAKYKILFSSPQRAITPGQSIVFYHRKELLGGGIIC